MTSPLNTTVQIEEEDGVVDKGAGRGEGYAILSWRSGGATCRMKGWESDYARIDAAATVPKNLSIQPSYKLCTLFSTLRRPRAEEWETENDNEIKNNTFSRYYKLQMIDALRYILCAYLYIILFLSRNLTEIIVFLLLL